MVLEEQGKVAIYGGAQPDKKVNNLKGGKMKASQRLTRKLKEEQCLKCKHANKAALKDGREHYRSVPNIRDGKCLNISRRKNVLPKM